MTELSHVDEASGALRMVDVGGKAVVRRRATARGTVRMAPETARRLRDLPKGGFSFYAVKPGYVPGAYSKRLPDINATAQLMKLNDGDRVTDVTITL